MYAKIYFQYLSSGNLNINVVYLAWLPYGIAHFKVFIDSYKKYDSGYSHELVIVFNGLASDNPNKPDEYIEYIRTKGVEPGKIFYFQDGQDIAIYKQTAAALEAEFILFLNTYSELLSSDWLKSYAEAFDGKTGLVSASGSFQSYYSSVFQKNTFWWEFSKPFLYNFRKYKLFLKAFFYWRFLFKPFPNPHIRTNAFMIKRTVFLEMKTGPVDSKFKAYQFENGRKSLTCFCLSKGLKVLVVNKYGKTFEQDKWKESATFWMNNQENLLVSDNQTRIYETATEIEKKEMTWLAWGTL